MQLTQSRHETLSLVGRVLLAAIFVTSGLAKIPGWDQTLVYMASQGMPAPALFLFPTIFIEVLGGLSILLGIKTRIGASILFLYLIPVTLVFHSFWLFGGIERQVQMVNFLKNLAIMGGLAILSTRGPGALSLDHWIAQRKERPKGPHLRAA
jgi:putative oxidoreductase